MHGHALRIRPSRGTVIVRSSQPAHHPPQSGQSPDNGLTLLDEAARAMLQERRWREARRHRRQHWPALAVTVLLHVLFLLVTWRAMRPRPPPAAPVHPEEVLQVRFITHAANAVAKPPPPQALPPPPAPHAPPKPREPVAKDAMTIQLPPPKPASTASLYDKNGQPLLPATAASAPTPGYVQHLPQGDAQIMRHDSPVKYQATRFEQYFPPPDETAGGAVVRHAVDAVIKSKDVDLPGGVHLKCMTVLGIPTPNCGMPPAGPSAKDGDERLSMAPAKPLDGDARKTKKPSVEACIAMYRDGKPLAWGCPVDTPNRAIDAEQRERAAGAARSH
jgi:hypothetical protein